MTARPRPEPAPPLRLVPQPRAAIYARVSDPKQESNYSLPSQEAAMRAYCAEQGYTLAEAHVYREVHTASDLWERPALAEVRAALDRREVDVLVCYDPDRFSRKQIHSAMLQDICERAGAELKFAMFDFARDATGQFLLNARVFAAELELEKLKERTMRGIRTRVQSGKPIGGGRVPYGYRWRDAAKSGYEPDERTAPIVRRIFAQAAEGFPIRRIAAALNDEGVQTAHGGGFWRAGVVLELLRRPIYAGRPTVYRWHRRRVAGFDKPRMGKRPAEEQVVLPADVAPALVEPDIFDQVQDRLDRNRVESTRRSADPTAFLLRAGHVYCGYCGRRAVATWRPVSQGPRKGQKEKVYCLFGKSLDTHRACGYSFAMGAEEVDRAVWGRVRAVLTHPEIIEAEVARLARADTTASDLGTVDRAIAAVKRQQVNVAAAIAALDNPDAQAPLLAQLRDLAAQLRAHEAGREDVARREATAAATRDRLTTLAGWCQRVAANLDALTYEERRLALTALGVRVELFRADHEPRYRVHFAVPLEGLPDLDADCSVTESPSRFGHRALRLARACGTSREVVRLSWTDRELAALGAD